MTMLIALLWEWPLIRQIRERTRAVQASNGDDVTKM
jgi:hypothetical protein